MMAARDATCSLVAPTCASSQFIFECGMNQSADNLTGLRLVRVEPNSWEVEIRSWDFEHAKDIAIEAPCRRQIRNDERDMIDVGKSEF